MRCELADAGELVVLEADAEATGARALGCGAGGVAATFDSLPRLVPAGFGPGLLGWIYWHGTLALMHVEHDGR